ncbi:uncharacterized protein LOC119687071 [Teleopsis dalmanni]|uniref:uncharacterized protein LOC119687071 n=1 Tax=Teleopsis dalmanni TaxID=139649 RepID=UPI0018CFEE28|nr:uncharacterized protein LOC119687071 [Teleopsis dalmanni]
MKVFHFAGVRVERSISNESQLVLDAVNLASTGKYSCEVSADAPSFHTLIAAGELDVVEVPHNAPFIIGLRPRYRIGDILRGNCTSRHSKPAANITWTVNNDEVNPVHVRYHKVLRDLRIDYETSVSGIHFIVTPHHFLNGKMRVICSAQIYDVYFKSTERIIIDLDYQQKYASVGSNVLMPDDNYDQLHVVQDGEFLRKKDNNYLTQLQEFFFNVVPTGENTDNSVWFTSSSGAYCYTSINTVPVLLMTTILLCYCNLSCLDEFVACMVQCTTIGNRSKQYQSSAPSQLCATLTSQHRRRKWPSVQQAQQ